MDSNFDLVIFGGTGDLALRKLYPALFLADCDGRLHAQGRIIAAARQNLDDAAFRAKVAEALQRFVPKVTGAATDAAAAERTQSARDACLSRFLARLTYFSLDVNNNEQYVALKRSLDERDSQTIFYLSVGPTLFPAIIGGLKHAGLNTPDTRIVLEKPLGRDLNSSREINALVLDAFAESQVYRIDHYLGKETVQNLLALRFGNTLMEPLWNRTWVRDVQITIAETVGVETRGEFYDGTGAFRDMVQNHLLNLLCITAMEPPSSLDPDAVRDEKLQVLRSLKPWTQETLRENIVRGQYRAGSMAGMPANAYVAEEGVATHSSTETYVALRTEILNWRWSGVPFYLRTGKRMSQRRAEVVINFKSPPHSIFETALSPNRLVITLQPEESVRLYTMAKAPGDGMSLREVHLDLDFKEFFRERRQDAYERLLLDVLRGNATLFMRRDEADAAWRWCQPVLDQWAREGAPPIGYAAGSWGPPASSRLTAVAGSAWHEELGV
jgi:glucose-6-phosphate 1-dehydrogenase